VQIAHLSIDPEPPHSIDRVPEAGTTFRYLVKQTSAFIVDTVISTQKPFTSELSVTISIYPEAAQALQEFNDTKVVSKTIDS